MSKDMTELEKAADKASYETWMLEHIGNHERNMFVIGFKEALKPEHMKLTEEVRGLIEAIREDIYEINEGNNPEIMDYYLFRTLLALKPFEKESE